MLTQKKKKLVQKSTKGLLEKIKKLAQDKYGSDERYKGKFIDLAMKL